VGGYAAEVTAVKLVVGILLFLFALADVLPSSRDLSFAPRYLAVGGALSGFFGGLSGMQGALRSAFLVKVGLSKEAFIATGVVVAALIDISRLAVYVPALMREADRIDYALLGGAVLAAFAGAYLGKVVLSSVTMSSVRRIVAAMLFVVAAGLVSGVLRVFSRPNAGLAAARAVHLHGLVRAARGPITGHRGEAVLLEGEHVFRDNAVCPFAGLGLPIELLIGQPDQRSDESGALDEPLGGEAFHRGCGHARFVSSLQDLARVDLLVVDVIGDEGPNVLALRARVRRGLRQFAVCGL
jgi:hypothetical protein